MFLSGILVKIIQKYKKANPSLTDDPQTKTSPCSTDDLKSDVSKLREFSQSHLKFYCWTAKLDLVVIQHKSGTPCMTTATL